MFFDNNRLIYCFGMYLCWDICWVQLVNILNASIPLNNVHFGIISKQVCTGTNGCKLTIVNLSINIFRTENLFSLQFVTVFFGPLFNISF